MFQPRKFPIVLALSITATWGALNVPLEVANWASVARAGEPVTAGVPLPQGAVTDLSKFRLVDGGGTTIPAQFRALSRWWWEKNQGLNNNPSVKWVLCDFQSGATALGKTTVTLKDDNSSVPTTPLTLTQDGSGVTVVTGPLKFTVSKLKFNLFDVLSLDANNNGQFEAGEQLIAPGNAGGGTATAGNWSAGGAVDGVKHTSAQQAPERVVVEEEGPLKVVIRIEGRHYAVANGVPKGLYGYQVFVTAYAGQSIVDVQWALTNTYMEGTEPEAGSSPYTVYAWPLKEYTLDLNLSLGASQSYSLLGASEAAGTLSSTVRLLQTQGSYTLTGAAGGSDALGGGALSDGTLGLRVALRDFASNNPKAISLSQNKMTLELFPNTGATFSLDPYSRKNHRMRFEFFKGGNTAGALLDLSKKTDAPLRLIASREWYRNTRAWERGFGVPDQGWSRLAPAAWKRMTKTSAGRDWTNFGEIGEFNGGGDHWNLTSAFWEYLLTGDPQQFESSEAAVLYFNDIVSIHTSSTRWQDLDAYVNESKLAAMRNYHNPEDNYNVAVNSFPGFAFHRSNRPDAGHMPNKQELEYYLLTGDWATRDAMESEAIRAAAHLFWRTYGPYSGWPYSVHNGQKVVLDSFFVMAYGPRYIARPGLVCNHAYEVTGDNRYLYPATIAAYAMRNYVRESPIGYLASAGDLVYMDTATVNPLWRSNHPGVPAPVSYAGSDFQIGIGIQDIYNYWELTHDEEIRDAVIFSGVSFLWRIAKTGSTYGGFTYSGWGDYVSDGRRYNDVGLAGSYYSSASEGFGGHCFSYLASGRADFYDVVRDGLAKYNAFYPGGNTVELKLINMWEAKWKHDSLDVTPPAAVADLSAAVNAGKVEISWTAPGDDGTNGTAAEYQIKFAKVPMADAVKRWDAGTQTGWPDINAPLPYTSGDLIAKARQYSATREIAFWAAQNAKGEIAPQAAGSNEKFTVPGLTNNTAYYFALVAFDKAGNVSGISNVVSATSGVEAAGRGETAFQFSNVPNPFNGTTRFRVQGFGFGNHSSIRLTIYDSRGRVIRRLEPAQNSKPGTSYDLRWDGLDIHGAPLPAGLYLCRLTAGGKSVERKLVLIK